MYDVIVLAGGAGRRLGGVDKAMVVVGGVTLLDRVLAATSAAGRVVVVGPPRDLPESVLGTSERPPGGGPVAALVAGLELVEATMVAVLACDLPFVTAGTITSLAERMTADGAGALDGVQLVDEGGRRQPLTAVYRAASLRKAVAGLESIGGTPMRAVVGALTMLDVGAEPGQVWDCDTWVDVRRARSHADEHPLEEP